MNLFARPRPPSEACPPPPPADLEELRRVASRQDREAAERIRRNRARLRHYEAELARYLPPPDED